MNDDNELFANQLKVDENKESVVTPDPSPNTENVTQEEKKVETIKPKKNHNEAKVKFVKFITSDFAMQNVIIQMGF